MIEIYKEVAQVLDGISGLSYVGVAPRGDADTSHPAAYVVIDELTPMNLLGNNDGTASATFTIEYWLKPVGGQPTKVDDLIPLLKLVENVRKALLNYRSECIYNISLVDERTDVNQKSYHVVKQQWSCTANLWSVELMKIPNGIPISLDFELKA